MTSSKWLSVFFVFTVLSVFSQQSDCVEDKLFELPDVIFKEIKNSKPGTSAWELKIKQPIDHNNPDGGYFYQRAFLDHIDFNKPVVFVTEGYSCSANWPTELSKLLDANQIAVEHRYFGESIPDTSTYDFLNLFQATSDLHNINKIFKSIYTGSWVSTGISKGGATTIFYKYFFPTDVQASVPYVAPVNLEFEESRIYTFLDTIGSDSCRLKIFEFQQAVLKNREQILPLLKFYAKGARLGFSYLTLEEAFEFAVLEYPFSSFQWGYNCSDIPGENADYETITNYLLDISGIDFFSDASMEAFSPHYYQSATEMGYYGYETSKFKGLLKSVSTEVNPHAAFVPSGNYYF